MRVEFICSYRDTGVNSNRSVINEKRLSSTANVATIFVNITIISSIYDSIRPQPLGRSDPPITMPYKS